MMEKKLFFFIFFLGSLLIHGQTDYAILIKSKITSNSVWPGNDYNGLHQITAGLNSCSIYFFEENYKDDLYCFFYVTGDPKELSFTEILGGSPICGQIRRTTAYNKDNFAGWFFSGCLANSEIMSLHIPELGITPKCNEDIITLKNGWNWRYQLQGGKWENFPPQFQAQPSISFKIKDLPGYSNQLSIRFQSGYQGQFTNIVTYPIIGCSPELAEKKPSTTNVKCNNTATGSATLKFQTELKAGNQFLFNLFLANPVAPDTGFIRSVVALEDEIDNKTFTWDNIAAGTYIIKYQAQNTSDDNQHVGLSAIATDPFTIEEKPPLTFWATAIQPVCSDTFGAIEVRATGGSPPYYYILDNLTEAIDGKIVPKKIQFSGSYSIPITTDGDHTVKIVDTFNCEEQ